MGKRVIKTALIGALVVAGVITLLVGCESAGAGDSSGSGSTCDDTTTHTVEWRFSGGYTDSVSVATTWVKPSGEMSDPSDPKYASIDPSDGTLLTESLPGCTGASINITLMDTTGGDTVTLTNVTLSIYVDGTLVDSVSFSGTYPEGTILPSSGALTIVVGE
ncbi:MAG: hypothetical protein R6V86_12220 [Spirochaetia bacterium]